MRMMLWRKATDDALLRAIADGTEDAFAEFYERHRDAVVAFCSRRTGDPELAFDLAAETFAVVVADSGGYRGQGPAVGWLFGVARNKLGDSLRRGRVADEARQRLGLERVVLTDADLEEVERRAMAGESVLDRALDDLPPEVRMVLVARLVEERDYSDIAAQLGCSNQVVRQRVHRGLRRLRTRMEAQR